MDLTLNFRILFIIFFTAINSVSSGTPCASLNGTWYNELGSMMTLQHSSDGELTGTYHTIVERQPGSSGGHYSIVAGTSPYNKPGAVFGFTVMWKNGSSITSWTGQCMDCGDGLEVLETSWILKIKIDSCDDIWKSTMIGQNTFTRDEADAKNRMKKRKREITQMRYKRDTEVLQNSTNSSRFPCSSLTGIWYNRVGSVMNLHQHHDNDIRGEYRTAVEKCDGAAGSGHSEVFGVSNSADPSSALTLTVVWNNGESITGWAGQCHICGQNGTEKLVLTWLLRTRVDSCHDNWLTTNYGEAIFTRHEHIGPLIDGHTGRESGEVSPKASSVPCISGALTPQSSVPLSICSLILVILKYFK